MSIASCNSNIRVPPDASEGPTIVRTYYLTIFVHGQSSPQNCNHLPQLQIINGFAHSFAYPHDFIVMPFPQFEDGDVEIRFTDPNDEPYYLHSFVLGLHSSWFKASLSERWSNGKIARRPLPAKTDVN